MDISGEGSAGGSGIEGIVEIIESCIIRINQVILHARLIIMLIRIRRRSHDVLILPSYRINSVDNTIDNTVSERGPGMQLRAQANHQIPETLADLRKQPNSQSESNRRSRERMKANSQSVGPQTANVNFLSEFPNIESGNERKCIYRIVS